ncbi:Ran-binding protein 3 [Aphelenchoides fujianensis]|nr:Ran-binding protein 3 [Aphelenchoides fujianensis]
MAETAKTLKSEEKPTLGAGSSSSFLKKSALSQAAANQWTAATSAFSGKPAGKPASLVAFDLSGGKKATAAAEKPEATAPKVEAPSGFVFGSKLASRVNNAETADADAKPKDVSSIFKQVAGSGTTGLFLSGKAEDKEVKTFADSKKADDEEKPKCADAAPEIVETFTGEEGERNLLHLSCKFFFFDVTEKNWQERGLGTLRINENIETPNNYRIIGRATGNQRVCINTNVFPEMVLEKLTDKRLRISAVNPDSETPQLFVIQASPASIQSLHRMLEDLLPKVKNAATRKRRLDSTSADDCEVPPKNAPVDRTAPKADEAKPKKPTKKSEEQPEDPKEADTSKDAREL